MLRHVYTEFSRGNPEPLLASLAEDIEWTIIGTTVLAGRSRGKQEVIEKLLRSPRARLAVRSNASRSSSSPKVRVSSCRRKAGDSEERQALQQCVLHRIRRRRVQLAGPGPLGLLEPGGARLQSAGQPGDNPLIEAFNGRLRHEYLSQHWFLSLVDVQATLDA